MRICNYIKSALAAVAAALAAQTALADLVWTADKGWQVQGGVIANVLGEEKNVTNALQAMNEGKKAQEDGSNRLALSYYKTVITQYPDSIFAPEAYYQMSLVYTNRGQFMDAFESLEEVVKRYPDYPKFNQIIGEEYNVASVIQGGATPYLWGWFPWFTNYNDAIKIYEGVVKNAPYSDYAPIALMNISLIAEQEDTPEVAFDALDRLINNYPNSMFAPDAYMQMAKVYRSMVEGPEYDQTPTRSAISFYQDYLILFPKEAGVSKAEEGLDKMRDTYARSRLIMGDFFYYYRNNHIAASIFYNEAITLAPDTPAADEARTQLKKIKDGILAPMTPYDWFWGRYEKPEIDQFEDETITRNLDNQAFEIMSVDDFIATPAAVAGETIGADGSVKTYEGLAPIFGEPLDDFLFEDGFRQWTSDEIEKAQ